MGDRTVYLSVDRQEDEPRVVTTSLPQESPVSPVLFAIYMSDIRREVEGRMEAGQREGQEEGEVERQIGVEGEGLLEVVMKMEECAERSLRWAAGNAVRVETSKTEATFFTRNKKQRRKQGRWTILVGEERVKFAKEATRWLGV